MLQQSVEKRVELQGLLREVIASTTAVKQKLKLVALTHTAKEKMISAPEFKVHNSLLALAVNHPVFDCV